VNFRRADLLRGSASTASDLNVVARITALVPVPAPGASGTGATACRPGAAGGAAGALGSPGTAKLPAGTISTSTLVSAGGASGRVATSVTAARTQHGMAGCRDDDVPVDLTPSCRRRIRHDRGQSDHSIGGDVHDRPLRVSPTAAALAFIGGTV
jgi:hypothetical protein